MNGVRYKRACGNVEKGRPLYYCAEGDTEVVPCGTLQGFSIDGQSVVVMYSDGGLGNINRDTIRYQNIYWVRE